MAVASSSPQAPHEASGGPQPRGLVWAERQHLPLLASVLGRWWGDSEPAEQTGREERKEGQTVDSRDPGTHPHPCPPASPCLPQLQGSRPLHALPPWNSLPTSHSPLAHCSVVSPTGPLSLLATRLPQMLQRRPLTWTVPLPQVPLQAHALRSLWSSPWPPHQMLGLRPRRAAPSTSVSRWVSVDSISPDCRLLSSRLHHPRSPTRGSPEIPPHLPAPPQPQRG